jgi:hypothetical protein
MARKKKLDPIDIAAEQRAREQAEVEQAFLTGINTLRDLIAPSSLEIHSSYFRVGTKYGRTLYVYGYPRQIYTGWLSSLINIDEVLDISMFVYPVESQVVLRNLQKKVTQLNASMDINSEKAAPATQVLKPPCKTPKNSATSSRSAPSVSSVTACTSRSTPIALTSSALFSTRSRLSSASK